MGRKGRGTRRRRGYTFRVLASIALLSACTLPLAAQSSKSSAPPPAKQQPATAVFITSNPIGAVVVVDRKTILSRTPVLLRDLSVGKHRVDVARRGYSPESKSFEVSGGKPTVVSLSLKPEFIDPLFPANQKVTIDGHSADYGKERYYLPAGEYRVGKADGAVSINPVFPNQQVLGILNIATAGLLTTSAILAGEAIMSSLGSSSSQNNNSNNNNGMGGQIAVWSISGLATLSDIFMHIQKARYLRAYAPQSVPVRTTQSSAEELYNRAQNLLGAGSLAAAAELYVEIIRGNTDSAYYPRALYQLAKVHSIEGDNLLAKTELTIILDKYPAPDLYDKTCKSLADLSYRQGDFKTALSYLDKMVFLDPLFPRTQIDAYRASIEQKLGGAGS